MSTIELGGICRYRTESMLVGSLPYVTTESMLPNKSGIAGKASAPSSKKARLFRNGDTLISNIRPYFKKIWQAEYDGCCSADVLVFEPSNCDADYLYWLLSNDVFFSYMVSTAKGTKMPRGDKSAIMHYALEHMDVSEQRAIVGVLNPIRELIATNQHTNDYLAALIRLEFDRRFSRETPTIDLGDVMSISTQSIKPNDHIGEIWEHYSIPAYDEMHRPIFELADGIKSNKYVIDSDCILVSKLNPSTKRLWLPRCTSKTSVCSTEFIVYRPKKVRYKSFYYAAIDSETFFAFLLSHVTGSTGSRQRSQPKATLNYPMPNPDAREIEDFCEFADPLIAQQQSNEQETDDLIRLRDTLLPKLISGELNIDKIV